MGKKKFYRTIVVKGKTYEYKVGKSYTKIKGIGEIYNGMIGYELDVDHRLKFKVVPSDVEYYILHGESYTSKLKREAKVAKDELYWY